MYSLNELNNGYLTTIQLVIILGNLFYRKIFTDGIKLEQYIDEALFLLENVIDVKVFSKSAKTPAVSPASAPTNVTTIKDKKSALDFLNTKGLLMIIDFIIEDLYNCGVI